jgi:hypothetical protein
MPEGKYLFKNKKCLAKNIKKLFVSEVFNKKCHIQCALMIIEV